MGTDVSTTPSGAAARTPWTVPGLPVGLPSGLPGLVGRSQELGDITGLLRAGELVTLTGPPGIGKTRLAQEVVLRLHHSYAGGAWFVDIAPVKDADLLPEAVSSVLGFDPEPGRDPFDALCIRLQPRSALLVLDNCEHLLGACRELAERIAADCAGITLLATSQEALGVTGERTEVVAALSLPAPELGSSVPAALESDAISLFCARAVATQSGFSLTEETLAPIAEICRRLDGIPLAIELAAARVAVLGPAEIAERLDARFRLLTQGRLGAPTRHQTMRAALDWSYGLLSAEESSLLRRLSVFVGGAGLTAVEDICSGDGVDRHDIVDLLTSLVAKSLVAADTTRARARYHLLETIRAYGRERLEKADEADAVSSRHAGWCIKLAERSWHQIAGGDARVWIGMLETDHDNLRAAMDWAADAEPATALQLTAALAPFWKAGGYLREGRQRLRRVLDVGQPIPGSRSAALRARALWGFGLLSTLQGDGAVARPAVEEAIEIARKGRFRQAEAQAVDLLALIAVFTQDARAAKPLLEDAVAKARAGGDVWSAIPALLMLGRTHLYLSEVAEALALFEECQELVGPQGWGALIGRGWAASAAGDERRAGALFERALPLVVDARERFETALVLSFLGELAWATGDSADARARFEDGLELARAMGAPFPLVRCLYGLATLESAEGRSDSAIQLAGEACDVSTKASLPFGLVRSLLARGGIRSAAGDQAGARQDFDDALALARANGDRAGVARSLQLLAALSRARGADDDAMGLLHEAVTLQSEIGISGLPSSMEAMAGMGADQGRPAHAARLYGAAEALRSACGASRRPEEVAAYEADVARLRAVLDVAELAAAWAEGAALSRDDAVELALRGRGPRDPDRPSHGWASLTPTERQVVDLVTEGMTNREIGERLFISDRTVQSHLGRVFPKLGVTSRRQLRNIRRRQRDDGSGREH